MNFSEIERQLAQLRFEDFLWITYAGISLANVYGDSFEEEYLKVHDVRDQITSNKIFEATILLTLLIYIYFFIRNVDFYRRAKEEDKEMFFIRLLGSSFLIAGAICLLYFQTNQTFFRKNE